MGLTNTQYNEIMRDYYRQQLKNQQELSERRQEIYHRFPEFHELDRRIASESCACARALLLEGTASQDSRVRMENRLKELTEQKTAILTGPATLRITWIRNTGVPTVRIPDMWVPRSAAAFFRRPSTFCICSPTSGRF